jgi:hypothetical protein
MVVASRAFVEDVRCVSLAKALRRAWEWTERSVALGKY